MKSLSTLTSHPNADKDRAAGIACDILGAGQEFRIRGIAYKLDTAEFAGACASHRPSSMTEQVLSTSSLDQIRNAMQL
jgi:hypothetical protein